MYDRMLWNCRSWRRNWKVTVRWYCQSTRLLSGSRLTIQWFLLLPLPWSSRKSLLIHLLQGYHASGKSCNFLLENFQYPESPRKWPWSWKVLEFVRHWYRWQILASNRHVSADENCHNCCHQVRFLCCRYAVDPTGGAYSAPDPLAAVCRYF